MEIKNSTQLLKQFIEDQRFNTVYTENNFSVNIATSNVRIAPETSIEYLFGAASVGNKVVGFYNKIPNFTVTAPMRGMLVLFTTNLPHSLTAPIFFCRKPDDLHINIPKAFKVATDTGVPVIIALAPNAINNFTSKAIPQIDTDRSSPYIDRGGKHQELIKLGEKLATAFAQLHMTSPQKKLGEKISFYSAHGDFPDYLFPAYAGAKAQDEQRKMFSDIDTVITTEREADQIFAYLSALALPNIHIKSALKADQLVESYLCPGCPFPHIFEDGSLSGNSVFTTIHCPAAMELFPLTHISISEYMGMTSNKLNTNTTLIANARELAGHNISAAEHIIVLADASEKPKAFSAKAFKFSTRKNTVFPYSCENIAKYPVIKLNEKKCDCDNTNGKPDCIKGAKCVAIIEKLSKIEIDKTACTGCRRCVKHCRRGALS